MDPLARPLSDVERGLLDGLLSHDFVGVEALRTQAESVLAMPGCRCGCGTSTLLPQSDEAPRSAAVSPVEVAARIFSDEGEEIGGLLLFLADGWLASLEVYSYDDPLPLPDPASVVWEIPGTNE